MSPGRVGTVDRTAPTAAAPTAASPTGAALAHTADLPTGTCHVWWARPTDAGPSWVEALDADERARLDALDRPGERQRFLAAHALTRTVLAAYLGTDPAALRFTSGCGACGGPHGKPSLVREPGARPVEFSVAGAGDRVAVAVAGDPIGLDVDELGRVSDYSALADMALRPGEQAVLDALSGERRPAAFLRYWTRKEAVLKALGIGRAVPPNRIEVSAPDERAALLDSDLGPLGPVQLFDLTPGGGSAACLAVLAEVPYRVEILAGTALLRH